MQDGRENCIISSKADRHRRANDFGCGTELSVEALSVSSQTQWIFTSVSPKKTRQTD
jgi:hypothetical protein